MYASITTVGIGLFMESVSEVMSSHSLLHCCLDGVCSRMSVFHLVHVQTYLEVVAQALYRQNHLPFAGRPALLQGDERKGIKNQGLKTFTSKVCVVCIHAAAPQGCFQCPVEAALESDGMQEC